MDGINFCSTISRARFEDLCFDLFESTIPPVEKALADANLEKKDIDHIVLVGGSTRIPKIQEMLSEFFDGKRLNKNLNPDEAVAYGAAVQAAILSGDTSDATRDIILTDVTPLSLGLAVGQEGSMDVVIPRNTIIPTSATRPYTTRFDNQIVVSFKVYEGERSLAEDNNLLGQFKLTDIPPAPRHVPKFKVTFHLDADAILNVSAIDVGTGSQNQVRIENDKGRLSRDDINRMLQDAEDHRLQDEEHKLRLEAKNELESYCNAVQRAIAKTEVKDKLSDHEYSELLRLLRDAGEVINGRFSKITVAVCLSNVKKLKEVWEPLVRNWYQNDHNAANVNGFEHSDNRATDPRVDAMLNKLRWNDLFLKVTLALVFTLILMILLF